MPELCGTRMSQGRRRFGKSVRARRPHAKRKKPENMYIGGVLWGPFCWDPTLRDILRNSHILEAVLNVAGPCQLVTKKWSQNFTFLRLSNLLICKVF